MISGQFQNTLFSIIYTAIGNIALGVDWGYAPMGINYEKKFYEIDTFKHQKCKNQNFIYFSLVWKTTELTKTLYSMTFEYRVSSCCKSRKDIIDLVCDKVAPCAIDGNVKNVLLHYAHISSNINNRSVHTPKL